ncbi:MAG TPA: hypothetical protein PK867_31285, partial [Pirellulales bacterium]|nr:hypothetical protein [Pirellulales bacterium]
AARRRVTVRIFVVVLFAACASVAMIALPSSNKQFGVQPGGIRQLPVRSALCLVFPAALAVGALQGRRIVSAFCGSALLPALMPAMLVCGVELIGGPAGGRWEPVLLFPMRYSIVVIWTLIPVFGLTGAGFYWLFRVTEPTTRDSGD